MKLLLFSYFLLATVSVTAQPFGKLQLCGSFPENFDYSKAEIFMDGVQIGTFQVSGTFYPSERLKGDLIVIHPKCDTFLTEISLKKNETLDVTLELKLEELIRIKKETEERLINECGFAYSSDSVDVLAKVPDDIKKFLVNELRYPITAIENYFEGTVYISFIVTEIGTIECINLLLGVEESIDKEALRVVQLFPKFSPAQKNGENVRSIFYFPVKFKLY